MFTTNIPLPIKSFTALFAGILLLFMLTHGLKAEERVAGPKYDAQGQLIRIDGWRQWVFIGAPLTPNSLNDGKAAFPEFHNVYMEPTAFAHYVETGRFPNGTMIAKELLSVGDTEAVSGTGYFQGDFQGLEFAVKDTKRFPNEPGGWTYYSFGHALPYEKVAKAFPTEACASCHVAAAEYDMVFLQYYPVLKAAGPK
ncbi:MAG: cytochrome P460 family protein [Sneathiella sp.]|nr:cytochrome P460 family protein [Sneathiella sp.]